MDVVIKIQARPQSKNKGKGKEKVLDLLLNFSEGMFSK